MFKHGMEGKNVRTYIYIQMNGARPPAPDMQQTEACVVFPPPHIGGVTAQTHTVNARTSDISFKVNLYLVRIL